VAALTRARERKNQDNFVGNNHMQGKDSSLYYNASDDPFVAQGEFNDIANYLAGKTVDRHSVVNGGSTSYVDIQSRPMSRSHYYPGDSNPSVSMMSPPSLPAAPQIDDSIFSTRTTHYYPAQKGLQNHSFFENNVNRSNKNWLSSSVAEEMKNLGSSSNVDNSQFQTSMLSRLGPSTTDDIAKFLDETKFLDDYDSHGAQEVRWNDQVPVASPNSQRWLEDDINVDDYLMTGSAGWSGM